MIVKAQGFSQDSDVDFKITPETDHERALLRAMKGRDVHIHYDTGTPMTMTFRTIVDGVRV